MDLRSEQETFDWLGDYNFDEGFEVPYKVAVTGEVSSRYLKLLNYLLAPDTYYLDSQANSFRKRNPEWKCIQYLELAIKADLIGNIDPTYEYGTTLDYQDYGKLSLAQILLRKPLICDLQGFIDRASQVKLPLIEQRKRDFDEENDLGRGISVRTVRFAIRSILAYYFPLNFAVDILQAGKEKLRDYALPAEYVPYFTDLLTEANQIKNNQLLIKSFYDPKLGLWEIVDIIEGEGWSMGREDIQYLKCLLGQGGHGHALPELDIDRFIRAMHFYHPAVLDAWKGNQYEYAGECLLDGDKEFGQDLSEKISQIDFKTVTHYRFSEQSGIVETMNAISTYDPIYRSEKVDVREKFGIDDHPLMT